MHILITRPHDDGVALKAKIEALGIQATLAPVLNLTFADLGTLNLDQTQALIVTSRNGLKSLHVNGCVSALATKPLFTVGQATADHARNIGFEQIIAGPGTAEGLAELIKTSRTPHDGPLHHIAGAHLAFDLKGALSAAGFDVDQTTAYRAEAVDAWAQRVVDLIKTRDITAVILMSARTASAFANLVKVHELNASMRRMTFICLSHAVKETLIKLVPETDPDLIQISNKPDLEELLALIARFAPN